MLQVTLRARKKTFTGCAYNASTAHPSFSLSSVGKRLHLITLRAECQIRNTLVFSNSLYYIVHNVQYVCIVISLFQTVGP